MENEGDVIPIVVGTLGKTVFGRLCYIDLLNVVVNHENLIKNLIKI